MTTTARFGVTHAVEGQSQGEITYNEGVNRFDTFIDLTIIDRDLTAPPGSPSEGDTYIVGASATGDWSGQDGDIAFYYSGWLFLTPFEGMRAWISDENLFIIHDGSSWYEATVRVRPVPDSASYSTGLHNHVSAGGTVTYAHTSMWLVPLVVDKAISVDAMCFSCKENTQTGTTCRMGLYDSDTNGEPGALLEEGTIAAGVIAIREITFTERVLEPGLYWLAFQEDNGHPGNTSLDDSDSDSCLPIHQFDNSGVLDSAYMWHVVRSYAAFPNPFSGTLVKNNVSANPPRLFVRAA